MKTKRGLVQPKNKKDFTGDGENIFSIIRFEFYWILTYPTCPFSSECKYIVWCMSKVKEFLH